MNDDVTAKPAAKAARQPSRGVAQKGSAAGVDSGGPHTLAIDIGGTHLKAVVLGPEGAMIVDEAVLDTPHPCPPQVLLECVGQLAAQLPAFDRVSAGFPGVVRRGTILTAPHLGTPPWAGFALAEALTRQFAKPARVLNDADVQGLGLIEGRGLEMVLTLGTGAGTALFREGDLMPHLELAHHPIHKKQTYDDYIGHAALHRKGAKVWNKRVHKAIAILRTLVNFDVLHIGGGNAPKLVDPPDDVKIGSNQAGLTGGIRLWDIDER